MTYFIIRRVFVSLATASGDINCFQPLLSICYFICCLSSIDSSIDITLGTLKSLCLYGLDVNQPNGPYSLLLFQITHISAPYGGNGFWVRQPHTHICCIFMHISRGILTAANKTEGSFLQIQTETRKSK